jgi:predicted transcriptional regulator
METKPARKYQARGIDKVRVSFRFDADLFRALKDRANQEQRSQIVIMQRALRREFELPVEAVG